MDVDGLRAFIAVAEAHSFSAAAERLYLTQPAVSKRIAALEEELDHMLFDRLGKAVALTEAGRTLLPRAISIVKNLEEARRAVRELSGEITGSLSVATSHHIGLHHLPPVLREFAAQHPKVNLQFEFLDSEKAHNKVLQGDCELAIVTLDPKLAHPLLGEVLWDDPLVFVAGKDHPLSQQKNVSLSELSQTPAILPDLNTFTGRLAKSCFDREDLALNLNMTTNYLETVKMMVSVGLGWSLLPLTLVDSNMQPLKTQPAIELKRQLGLITHQRRTLSNAARAFYNLLKDPKHS